MKRYKGSQANIRRDLRRHADYHGLRLISIENLTEENFPIALHAVCILADALFSCGDTYGGTIEPVTGISIFAVLNDEALGR